MNSSPSQQTVLAAEREAALRLTEFRQLRARGALCAEATEQLATEAANTFLAHFRLHEGYLADAITLLAEIATLEEPCLAESGQRATFPLLVEQLSDSFDPAYCRLYDRAFAQMITHCRRLPAASELDTALRRFGLVSETDLLERKTRLSHRSSLGDAVLRSQVRKVLVLSRITLGADVAITSLVLQKTKRVFPQAERVLLGLPKTRQLFGGDDSLQFRDVPYDSNGTLLERLQSWLPVLKAVEEEIRGLRSNEYVLIDPDSRLLQLGLLPALPDESRYFFLESRRYGELGEGCVGEITLRWLNGLFGDKEPDAPNIWPSVWLREEDKNWSRQICRRLLENGSNYLVAMSFGVGGNPLKRLSNRFEEQLLIHLLDEGCTVILDKGIGEDEIGCANQLVEHVRGSGHRVVELNEADQKAMPDKEADHCRMLTWQGGIGPFSALIAQSNEYIGYDSAGQHIAAAMGVPVVDIYTGATTPIFRERWRPFGPSMVKVALELDQETRSTTSNILQVIALHSIIRAQAPRLSR